MKAPEVELTDAANKTCAETQRRKADRKRLARQACSNPVVKTVDSRTFDRLLKCGLKGRGASGVPLAAKCM